MAKLVEMYEGEYERSIKKRLRSSNSSGKYYHLLPANFGTNASPYEPKFHVESQKFYKLKIIPELTSSLQIVREEIQDCEERDYISVILPRARRGEIVEFLHSFEKKAIFYNADCAFNGVYSDSLSRLNEVYVFDREKTTWIWDERRKLFEEVLEEFDNEELEGFETIQGNLELTRYEGLGVKEITEKLEEYSFRVPQYPLLNHLFRFDEWAHIFRFNFNLFMWLPDPQFHVGTIVSLLSYEHENVDISFEPDTLYHFHHERPRQRTID